MNPYTFHINLYDLAFMGTIFIGLGFSLQLWFTKRINQAANRFLALALFIAVLWIVRVLGMDIRLGTYFPRWSWLPLQFSLALGPLIFFYVLKMTRPGYKFRAKYLLHFSPLLLEQGILLLEIKESIRTSAATYDTLTFQQTSPVLHLAAFISVSSYLYWSFRLIKRFYQRLKFNEVSDRYRYELRWLHRLLTAFSILWLLWIPYVAIDYFYYPNQLSIHAYYPLYLLLAVMMIWIVAVTFLRTEAGVLVAPTPFLKPQLPAEMKHKGIWLKKVVKANCYYQDPELSLSALAEKLELTSHELSRIINTALKKSFNDFVNEYRVADVVQKMQDPAYDHITLLGIAFESGFNSKTTFHRIFKQMTGKSPAEYKTERKKEIPSYNLELYSRIGSVISYQETTPKWTVMKLNRNYMFKNNLKTAWRHIIRHKIYTTINVMGLALGICGCLVIYLVASFEFSFDTFHPDKERIYCVDGSLAGRTDDHAHWNSVPAPMPDAMRQEMTGFEVVAAFQRYRAKTTIQLSGLSRKFDANKAIIAQPQYFNILPYTWLSGSSRTALTEPNSVVLTESRARIYFGNLPADQVIGKVITYDDSLKVTVTGVLADWNRNSDFNFSEFISYATIRATFLKQSFDLDNWGRLNHGSQVLVKLAPNVQPVAVDRQFPAFVKKHIDPDPKTVLHIRLQPFTGIHFHEEYGGEGRKANLPVLYILFVVAIFILLIAVINFINLTTAQAIHRTKEIGIRKVLGSGKWALMLEFLTETFILSAIAVIIAVVFASPVLKLFADYIPPDVKFNVSDIWVWIFLALITLFTTLGAGFYPARLLSRFQPVSGLKGSSGTTGGEKTYLRKALIVFQFTISLIFIIGTIVMSKQVNYMRTKDLGFKTDAVITLRSLWNDQSGKLNVLAQQVRQMPGVSQVILEAFPPMGFAHMGNGLQLQGSKTQPVIQASEHAGDEHFVPFYDMKIIAGRNLLHADSTREYLINATCARALGFKDPQKAIGRLVIAGGGNKVYPVAGVVADFYENSFHQQIGPVFIAHDPNVEHGLALKLNLQGKGAGDIKALMSIVEKDWKKLYPDEHFEYSFLDEQIGQLYKSDLQTKWLMNTAMLLTIFISCMGLLGLAMFSTEKRAKEIGIRKVLGATVGNILTMLSAEITALVGIALLIASPLAWLLMNKWLQGFAYHTALSLWLFLLAGAGALIVSLATISFLAVRAAVANPVKSLRSE
ncbi:FtsX-like permease family protein [Mucilaginibacter sp.]|uniref:FtsX-like permease family protein n=1 Tax=Mucilaginibacter sp. TaxID=1882438 RepID=UPI00283D1072|nr:FtsX-like permease family protein [Mucilaginibacter sp.]MDR3696029.1 helix-turn-helix domain-containing protein [Mucilaginibacter sp.]